MATTTLSLFRFDRTRARLWAFAQMGLSRGAMGRTPGLVFWKLLGSGTGEGFTPVPNTSVYGILCVWKDEVDARAAIAASKVHSRYRAMSDAQWTVYLQPTSSRGSWSAANPFAQTHAGDDGPIAAMTRATIKPSILMKFWGRVPGISKVIGADPNVMFKIGVGEVPWFHQVTFSIWPDAASMANFARKDGPHAQAIKAVRDGQWFSEELYARFNVTGQEGAWADIRHPILPLADPGPLALKDAS